MSCFEIDQSHDPARRSWVPGADDHADFPVQNLPLGVFSTGDNAPRIGSAIGDHIADLRALAPLLPDSLRDALQSDTLNALFALDAPARRALRRRLSDLLSDSAYQAAVAPHLNAATACTLHLPARIGDYTDFYVGIHHATTIGSFFRPDNPLLPNYKYVPIGYHGRASSVQVSGTPLVRPQGQRKSPQDDAPSYGPTRRLDHELEMGVWIAGGTALGTTIPIGDAHEHVAGLCLLNDWSARDIQAWEYQPLGPFLAKNFLTSISPWVMTAEALAPFRIAQAPRPEGDPAPLPYLLDAADQTRGAFSITLTTWLETLQMHKDAVPPVKISEGPASSMYWTIAQMIAHHSSNGCNLTPGDLLGTGTISTRGPEGRGCLMEMTANGTKPLALPGGETRSFLEDGDSLTLRAVAHAPGFRSIGFGSCAGMVMAAH
jgi:fumarylacetoacetase